MTEKNITLYFCEGSSNKVYKASIEKQEGGFLVKYAYGAIGNTLRTGTKTQTPVDFDVAEKLFNKLVKSKTSKGYRPDEAQESEYIADLDNRDTGIRPQLLNPVDKSQVGALICDNSWWLQEKHDGVRMLAKVNANEVIIINRKGLTVGGPATIVKSLESVPNGTLLDGEGIGDYFHVFDLLAFEGVNTENLPYQQRNAMLETMDFGPHVIVTKTAKSTAAKKALLDDCKRNSAEGVVFKRIDSLYAAGRPSKGGNQLKLKFYKTASVVVTGWNKQRSIQMSVVAGERMEFVGNCTIPPSSSVPEINAIIEVRYLYAHVGGSLFQPTYLFERTDLTPDECSIEQLEFKRAA